MQIERLVQMIFYIVNHGHVTSKELADFFMYQQGLFTGISTF